MDAEGRAILDLLPPALTARVIDTPAGPALAVVGDQLTLVDVEALLSQALPAEGVPVGYVLVADGDGALEDLVRRSELTLVKPVPDSSHFSDVSPRRIPGLDWIRVMRSPLGEHTRGSINVYLVDTGDGVVLIDAGFSTEAPRLSTALEIAGIERGTVRALFVTHCHADHVGAAAAIRAQGWLAEDAGLVLHSETDRLGREMFLTPTDRFVNQLIDNGIAPADVPEWRAGLDLMADLANWPAEPRLVDGGTAVTIGEVRFEVVSTPGHSPDHVAIRASHRIHGEVVFLGDMTLGSKLPQCGVRDWESLDPIEDMRRSWQTVASGAAAMGLPGHGAPVPDLREFRAQFEQTYTDELMAFRRQYGGRELTAADVVDERTRAGDGFGPKQFVFYGAIAWFKHLERLGQASVVDEHPIRYSVELL